MSVSTDSEDEDLCLIKEATDDSFLNDFKANNRRSNNLDTGTHNLFPKAREKSHHYIRAVKDENEQNKLFEVTPQFQNYVAKALTNKLNESFVERLLECPKEKRRKCKNKDCIKLLNSSTCPIDMNKYEKDNILNDFSTYQHNSNSKKLKLTNCDQDLNVINSVVISGEDILNFTDIKYWSNKRNAKVFRYSRDKKGVLNYLESHYVSNDSDVIKLDKK